VQGRVKDMDIGNSYGNIHDRRNLSQENFLDEAQLSALSDDGIMQVRGVASM
jgi:hypothetical protein